MSLALQYVLTNMYLMTTTQNIAPYAITITDSSRSRDPYGRSYNRVFFRMEDGWDRGRLYELTSFNGGPVEVYRRDSDGIMSAEGAVCDFSPNPESALRATLQKAWFARQPSKRAARAWELSAR